MPDDDHDLLTRIVTAGRQCAPIVLSYEAVIRIAADLCAWQGRGLTADGVSRIMIGAEIGSGTTLTSIDTTRVAYIAETPRQPEAMA